MYNYPVASEFLSLREAIALEASNPLLFPLSVDRHGVLSVLSSYSRGACLNLGTNTDYRGCGLSWYSSVTSLKYWDSTMNVATTAPFNADSSFAS
jgi:hypothetical protein